MIQRGVLRPLVTARRTAGAEDRVAAGAFVRPFAGVGPLVHCHRALVTEALAARLARKRLLTGMGTQMFGHVPLLAKPFPADRARKRLLAGVRSLVPDSTALLDESLAAKVATEGLNASVSSLVLVDVAFLAKPSPAKIAVEEYTGIRMGRIVWQGSWKQLALPRFRRLLYAFCVEPRGNLRGPVTWLPRGLQLQQSGCQLQGVRYDILAAAARGAACRRRLDRRHPHMQENTVSAIPVLHQFVNPMQTMATRPESGAGRGGFKTCRSAALCFGVVKFSGPRGMYPHKRATLGHSRLNAGLAEQWANEPVGSLTVGIRSR